MSGLALAGLSGALALLWPAGASMANAAVATAQAPARHCVSHGAATLRALRQGEQRLVVVVKAFQPPKAQSGGLVVSLLTANNTRRNEITRFAIHPLRGFTAQEPARSQRFLVSLAELAHLVEDGKPLCIEVGFDTAAAAAEGGMAEIDVETVAMPGTPGK